MAGADSNPWVVGPAVPAPPPPPPPPAERPASEPADDEGMRGAAILVRLTEVERAVWHAAAKAEGRGKTAGWVRDVVAAHIEGRPAATGRDPGVDQARGELVRIGSNLNQVARALNVALRGGGPAVELGQVLAAVEATRAGLAQVRDELRGTDR